MKNPLHLRAEGFEFGAGKEADRTGAPAHDLGRELSLHNLRAIKKPVHLCTGFFEFGAGLNRRERFNASAASPKDVHMDVQSIEA